MALSLFSRSTSAAPRRVRLGLPEGYHPNVASALESVGPDLAACYEVLRSTVSTSRASSITRLPAPSVPTSPGRARSCHVVGVRRRLWTRSQGALGRIVSGPSPRSLSALPRRSVPRPAGYQRPRCRMREESASAPPDAVFQRLPVLGAHAPVTGRSGATSRDHPAISPTPISQKLRAFATPEYRWPYELARAPARSRARRGQVEHAS